MSAAMGYWHAKLPCQQITNSCPVWWVMPSNISASVPFTHLRSFPLSGLFRWIISFRLAKCWSASASTKFSMDIRGWFPLGRDWFTSRALRGLLRVSQYGSNQFFSAHLSLGQYINPYMALLETMAWLYGPLLASDVSALICCLGGR